MFRVMFVAGESSGDLHGGGVVRELKSHFPDAGLFGIGGDAMQAAGMELLHHTREMSVLGFAEVIRHLPFFRRVLRECEDLLKSRKPNVLVLIDYPGFNLKLARAARASGVPVVYYISPQVWAWHASRVKQMKECVDKMLVIFPFELEIYRNAGIPVEFVGHPLLEQFISAHDSPEAILAAKRQFLNRNGLDSAKPLVALFPGSRKQEIERILPTFVSAVAVMRKTAAVQAVVGAAPSLTRESIQKHLNAAGISLVENQTPALQRFADVAITKSGTSTLELAIAGTPMVVAYKTSALSYAIGKSMAQIDMIALPNIVAGKKIVPEFIQSDATPENISHAALALLNDAELHTQTKSELAAVRASLGTPGASEKVAEVVGKYSQTGKMAVAK